MRKNNHNTTQFQKHRKHHCNHKENYFKTQYLFIRLHTTFERLDKLTKTDPFINSMI